MLKMTATRWMRIALLIPPLFSFVRSVPVAAQSNQLDLWSDDFEMDRGWSMFEEIVNSCYGTGIGEVVRSTDAAFEGTWSLRLWANKALTTKSNHVIAQKKVSSSGQNGRYRYELYAFMAPKTASSGGETGPEFSMQNTRMNALGQFRTSTAGIQYRANPFSAVYRSWAVWAEAAQGKAAWKTFATTKALVPGNWYYLSVEADFKTNKYVRFCLRGPGIDLSQDLSSYAIAQEAKFTEQAFWLTLENENLYNNCGKAGSFDSKIYYDKVILTANPR